MKVLLSIITEDLFGLFPKLRQSFSSLNSFLNYGNILKNISLC